MGIIDALSDGFRGVAKRPGLLTLPILVDVCLWLAPRLSVDSLLLRSMPSPTDVAGLGQPYEQFFEASRAMLQDGQATTNLWAAFSLRAVGLTSLTAETLVPSVPWQVGQAVIEIQSWTAALGCSVLLAATSLLVALFILALLAQVTREEGVEVLHVLGVTVRSWARMVGASVAGILIVAVLGGSAVVIILLLNALNAQLGNLVMQAFMLSVFAAAAYVGLVFFFFVRAVVLDDTGIRRSLWSALNVVHRGFFTATVFIILFSVIQVGLLLVWDGIARSVAGTAVSIVGNAYINMGLVLGSLIFYRERLAKWQEAAAKNASGL